MSDDLIAFLRARLDEDEERARAVESHDRRWDYLPPKADSYVRRFNPDRVLAEVDAKRQIIDLWDPNVLAGSYFDALAQVLRLLALPDAGHPEYRDEWRP